MSLTVYNNKYVTSGGKLVSRTSLPSESPALTMLHNFRTGMGAIYADWDRLAVDQAELESYGVMFSPSGVYTFSYTLLNPSLGYCNAQSSDARIHSFTCTFDYLMYDITCEKIGTTPPGVADYTGGVLSCPIGSDPI